MILELIMSVITSSPLQCVKKLNVEMEHGYKESLKQAILDYILLDTNEQARLEITLPEHVIIKFDI